MTESISNPLDLIGRIFGHLERRREHQLILKQIRNEYCRTIAQGKIERSQINADHEVAMEQQRLAERATNVALEKLISELARGDRGRKLANSLLDRLHGEIRARPQPDPTLWALAVKLNEELIEYGRDNLLLIENEAQRRPRLTRAQRSPSLGR